MAAFSPSLFDDAKVQKIREITKYFSCKRLLIICTLFIQKWKQETETVLKMSPKMRTAHRAQFFRGR